MNTVKLAIIGGAGVRAPLVAASAVRRAERLGLREVWLADIDANRLKVFGALAEEIVARSNAPLKLMATTEAQPRPRRRRLCDHHRSRGG